MAKTDHEKLISEEAFLPLLNEFIQDFFRLANFIKSREAWAKRYYAILAEKAHNMESYLDDYHARKNKRFSFLAELFASLKWFSHTAFIQKHVLIRFQSYDVDAAHDVKAAFLEESDQTLNYLNDSIRSLLENLDLEAKALKLDIPGDVLEEITAHDVHETQWLPNNIDEEEFVDQKHIIAEVAAQYKNIVEILGEIKIDREADLEQIKSETLFEFDETRTRHLESLIHSIQSKYDTFIKGTLEERRHRELSFLRGHASICLHLHEMATMLVHFYERHQKDSRFNVSQQKLCRIVKEGDLLKVLNGYFRYYGIYFFLAGEKHADTIIKTYLKVQRLSIKRDEQASLHARPLSLIAKIALHYNTPLEMQVGEDVCNANSIMQMIMAVGNNPSPREIIFRGEEEALRDVRDLFDIDFFRDGDTSKVPENLSYLLDN